MIDNDKHRKRRIRWLHCKHEQFRKGSKGSREAHIPTWRVHFILEIPHKFWYMIVSKGCYTYVKTISQLILRFKCNSN